jgi:(p)ppGpp synthase/HD superfamily hydrolase
MVKMSDDALLIKLADRLHNLSDITTVNKKFAEKMYNQTTFIIQELRDKRSLNNKHKKLIRLINKQLSEYKK